MLTMTFSFGHWLKQQRRSLDLTQDQLAERIGCSSDLIRKIEAGTRRPSRFIAERLAHSLQVAPENRQLFVRYARQEPRGAGESEGAHALPQVRGAAEDTTATPQQQRNNLPAPTTLFIGREQELAAAKALLCQEDVRLVTFTGPGGVGKTRLSLQVAAEMLPRFVDGVFFVSLAPIRTPDLVIPAIAEALGVRETGAERLIERLKVWLRERQMLLLLDNFEHLIAAAPLVADVLAAAPLLKLLITSRELLRLSGERSFLVPPLALPTRAWRPPVEQLIQYEAVQLFIERAQAVKPDFQVTNANAPAVAEICERLDGLPLAIELAAARIRLLPPQTLLERLGSRLALLTQGARDLPERQQALRRTIDWSYDLLDESEQQLFRRLAVFVGGHTLEAVEIVCNADGNLSIHVLEGLTSLLDKSLLQQRNGLDGEPRFVMLETIREYALEQLAESDEAAALSRRHVEYFLALVERAEPHLTGSQQHMWVERLESEHDNLRTAIARALEGKDPASAVRLGAALWRFWWLRGHVSEGRKWLTSILTHPGAEKHTAAYARVQTGAGYLAIIQCDYMQAQALLEESRSVLAELGTASGSIYALSLLGDIAYRQADWARATVLFEQALAFYRDQGDQWGIAASLMRLGNLAFEQGDYARAATLFEQSLVLFRKQGDIGAIISLMNALGVALRHQGDSRRARALFEEALALCRKLDYKDGLAWSLRNLGDIAHEQGRHKQARAYFVESLTLKWALGDQVSLIGSLARLANVAIAQGGPVRAVQLYGAVVSLTQAMGLPLPLTLRADYERTVAAARSQLDEATFVAAWAVGQAMTLEQAIACALAKGS